MKGKRKTGLSLATKHSLYGFVFTSPFILGFIFLFLSPLVLLVKLSFSSYHITTQGMQLENIWFENYHKALFVENGFMQMIFESLRDMLITCPVILLYSFFMAIILNEKFKGRIIARILFFLPVIISSGMAAYLQSYTPTASSVSLLNGAADSTSTVNLTEGLMGMFGSFLNSNTMDYLENISSKIYTIVSSSGVQIIIFLAGLQTISPSLYEASSIEGSSSWEDFWKITLPMISPLIIVNAVYTLIDSLAGSSNKVINLVYNSTMGQAKFGYGSAQSILYFIVIFFFLGLAIYIINKFVFYDN